MGFPRLILIPATFLLAPLHRKYRGDLKNMDPLALILEFSRLSLHSKSTNEYLMNYFSIIWTLKGVYILLIFTTYFRPINLPGGGVVFTEKGTNRRAYLVQELDYLRLMSSYKRSNSLLDVRQRVCQEK